MNLTSKYMEFLQNIQKYEKYYFDDYKNCSVAADLIVRGKYQEALNHMYGLDTEQREQLLRNGGEDLLIELINKKKAAEYGPSQKE